MENEDLTTTKKSDIVLSKAQLNFLTYCRKLCYGKLEVTIKDGEPVLAIKKEEAIKFD